MHSIGDEFDLLVKLYIPDGGDAGMFINDKLLDVVSIERSMKTLTFKVF